MTHINKRKIKIFAKKEYTLIGELGVGEFNDEAELDGILYYLKIDFNQDSEIPSSRIKKCYRYIGESDDGTKVLLIKINPSYIISKLEKILDERYITV